MSGLCFRCEHRARFFEKRVRLRYECGDVEHSKIGCYMYLPVQPAVLKPDKDDKRPQFGPPIISLRSYYVRTAGEMELKLEQCKDGTVLYWGFKDLQRGPEKGTLCN